MKLTQVKGNTYVLEGWEFVPLYKTDDTHCILLDTALKTEREELDASLAEYGLIPVGILNTHAHTDHAMNDRYFREKYLIPAAMPRGEAALCSSPLTLKCYYYMFSPAIVHGFERDMLQKDVIPIGPEDGPFEFLGVSFHIIHTPGHAPDHISVVTPDGVCYVGDAVLATQPLKLPYAISYATALESIEKLCATDYSHYILAHRKVVSDLKPDAQAFSALILKVAQMTAGLITGPMTEDQVCAGVCEKLELLSSRPGRAMDVARNVHALLEFLLERGDITVAAQRGVRYFSRASSTL